jgi:hypothetical protein
MALSPQVAPLLGTEFWITHFETQFRSLKLRQARTKLSTLGYGTHKETSDKGKVGEVNSVAAYNDITGSNRFQPVTWRGTGTNGITSPPKGDHPTDTLKGPKIKQATSATYVPYSLMFHTCEQYSPLVHHIYFCHLAPSVPKDTVLAPFLQ